MKFYDENHHVRCEARRSPRAGCRCRGHDQLYRTPDDRIIAQTIGRLVLALNRRMLTGYHYGELLTVLNESSQSSKPDVIRALRSIAEYVELTNPAT